MDKQVAVVTDSISCLTKELIEQYKIIIVPIRLLVQGKVYRDSVDITPSEAYEVFLQDPEKFNTSPSAPGHYLEAYREASKKAKNVVCVTLSSFLSTGYDMARIAMEDARTELPDTHIEVIDSKNVTAAEGFIALAVARAAAEGKDLAEAVEAGEVVKDKVKFLAFLDTIRYVYRTGRIPKVASNVGSMLSIKPILTNSSGKIRFAGAVRSREHGVERMLDIVREKVGQKPVHMAVMHAFAPDAAGQLMARVSAEFNCAELWITEFSPLMGYACGTGTLGFAFYAED